MKNVTFSPSIIEGEVRIPSSKSQAHRALICAALAGNSRVSGVDLSNDVKATAGALGCLGAELIYDGDSRTFHITASCTSEAGTNAGEINCGESASTLRFFIPIVAALGTSAVFTGEGRLPKRPTDMYKSMLENNGAVLAYPENGEYLPLLVSGKLTAGKYSLRGDVSSQFVTGLLLALSVCEGTSLIEITTKLESKPYADLTLDVLRRFGTDVAENGDGYTVVGGKLSPCDIYVEGDCSQAAFFAVAAALGGHVKMFGINPETRQGDFALFSIVERFGASVTWEKGAVTVKKNGRLKACDIDASDIPDLVPALAVMAALSEGTTRIYNAGRLRIKESDRIATTAAMLKALGADASETEDGLVITGKEKLCGGFVCSANDHRIAMAAAVASVGCVGDVIIDDMSCINKSYPEFVNDFRRVIK